MAAGASAQQRQPARSVCASASRPLGIPNDAPFRQAFLRPSPASACPVPALEAELSVTAANQFVDVRERARSAFLDAETYRIEIAAAFPLGRGGELRLAVPVTGRAGGFLDPAIERWHRIFRLPRGTRSEHPRGRVELVIAADSAPGGVLLQERDGAAGLGDARATFTQRLLETDALALAARAALELPTGDSSELLGSGAVDGSLGMLLTARPASPLLLHANADLALLGRSPLEGEGFRQAGAVTQLGAGIEVRLGETTSALAQVTSDGAPLELGIPALDRRSLLLALGLRRRVGARLELEGGFAEDLRVDTAPDFTLQAGARWSP